MREDPTTNGSRFALAWSEYVDASCIGANDGEQTGAMAFRNDTYFLAVGHGTNNDSIIETRS